MLFENKRKCINNSTRVIKVYTFNDGNQIQEPVEHERGHWDGEGYQDNQLPWTTKETEPKSGPRYLGVGVTFEFGCRKEGISKKTYRLLSNEKTPRGGPPPFCSVCTASSHPLCVLCG